MTGPGPMTLAELETRLEDLRGRRARLPAEVAAWAARRPAPPPAEEWA